MKKTSLQWRISRKDAGMRLLQFLRENCPKASSVKSLKRAIEAKLCTVNQRIETFSSYMLQENDLVVLDPAAFDEKRNVSELKVSILYEDDALVIVNKPAGLISDNASLRQCLPQFNSALELVHRLDKETTGVLILAKKAAIKEKMVELFKKRSMRKIYLALVDGIVEKEEGTIDNYLGKKHEFQGQTVYGAVDEKKGQHAITYWKCIKKGKTASLVACQPFTGRTHQLRVHMSGMGHPILGDAQYAKRFRCSFYPRRNLLHAYSISFKHPSNGKEIKAIAPIPADFKEAMEKLIPNLKKNLKF